ncbi:phage holin family protein [Providencia vermicola]|uniref:Phage holin family protein n=2 Tax=Providencia TaxID=586 RepID=A0AAI9I248_PROST|nr:MULTISPECIES: phage holin family protein [Providencia]ELR5043380.1 phage holin family protein [Providencia rettgeri]ELR5037066.1 phage holin family protein [Providencia stuartii]ELR5142281.1 phage holin family protein [Providencia stuartii]ELR5291385.1 phage holin family protein [Providencia stuartii]ELX8377715.1 phage holin family protein [Providencia stuartii]
MEQQERQGPGKGVLNTLQRIAGIAVQMVETRIQLIAVELEEEKATLIQLILMAGITLLFTAFGLMCLIGLIFWSVDPIYRYQALAITTGVLILLAITGAIWTLKKARQSTLLGATREQLKEDSKALTSAEDEQK